MARADGEMPTPPPDDAATVLMGLLSRLETERYPFGGYEVPLVFKFGIDSKGIVKVESGSARALLDLEGLNLYRVRRCEVCNAYYYQARDGSRACSERHTSTLRQRDYRKPDAKKGAKKR